MKHHNQYKPLVYSIYMFCSVFTIEFNWYMVFGVEIMTTIERRVLILTNLFIRWKNHCSTMYYGVFWVNTPRGFWPISFEHDIVMVKNVRMCFVFKFICVCVTCVNIELKLCQSIGKLLFLPEEKVVVADAVTTNSGCYNKNNRKVLIVFIIADP